MYSTLFSLIITKPSLENNKYPFTVKKKKYQSIAKEIFLSKDCNHSLVDRIERTYQSNDFNSEEFINKIKALRTKEISHEKIKKNISLYPGDIIPNTKVLSKIVNLIAINGGLQHLSFSQFFDLDPIILSLYMNKDKGFPTKEDLINALISKNFNETFISNLNQWNFQKIDFNNYFYSIIEDIIEKYLKGFYDTNIYRVNFINLVNNNKDYFSKLLKQFNDIGYNIVEHSYINSFNSKKDCFKISWGKVYSLSDDIGILKDFVNK